MRRTIKGIAAVAALLGMATQVNAASTTADALQIVTAAISIVKVSDLDFGTAAQGAVAKTVAPGAAEDAENGSFTVTGTPAAAYTITLPANSIVVMQTGAGGANETIAVDSFLSFPAAGANGVIGGAGTQLLLVGATRAALGAAQVAGSYIGAFTVDVVY